MLLTPESIHSIEREGVNFPIQSAGSDLMLLNMLHLWDSKDKFGIYPFWPYHDAITMNAQDEGMVPIIKKEMEEFSLDVVHGKVPFLWELSWGYNYAMDHGKESIR